MSIFRACPKIGQFLVIRSITKNMSRQIFKDSDIIDDVLKMLDQCMAVILSKQFVLLERAMSECQ